MRGSSRSRWFGAGLAVALGSGGLVPSDVGASLGSGERLTFVAITPCRLFDTRPGADNVGGRSTPIAAAETFTVQARGPQGKCDLPADTSALSLNVAVIGGTAASFLTVFPAGAALPLAANLNWVAGQPPTPNKVDVGLSADGQVSFYNYAGTVDVAADVNGYYVDHHHDDRYYTKAETDARLAGKADADDVARLLTGSLVISADSLVPQRHSESGVSDTYYNRGAGWVNKAGSVDIACFYGQAVLPDGVKITRIRALVLDTDATEDASVTLLRSARLSPTVSSVKQLETSGTPGYAVLDATIDESVGTPAIVYYVQVCLYSGLHAFRHLVLDYSIP